MEDKQKEPIPVITLRLGEEEFKATVDELHRLTSEQAEVGVDELLTVEE